MSNLFQAMAIIGGCAFIYFTGMKHGIQRVQRELERARKDEIK